MTATGGDGDIAVKKGLVLITKAGIAALIIANSTATTDEGCERTIIATIAFAHGEQRGSGFNDGGTSKDVATFGGRPRI